MFEEKWVKLEVICVSLKFSTVPTPALLLIYGSNWSPVGCLWGQSYFYNNTELIYALKFY